MSKRALVCACGRKYVEEKKNTHTFEHTVMTSPSVTSQPLPPSPVAKQVNQAREWDFTVPMLLSLASGLLATLTVLAFSKGLWELGIGLLVSDLFWFFSLVLFLAYRYELMRQLTRKFERVLGVDLDGDGEVGEPETPGRTIINSPGKRRPSIWRNLSAAKQQGDRIAFAVRMYKRQEVGEGVGQDAMKNVVLPSGFKVGRTVHVWIMKDMVDCGAAVPYGKGYRLCEFDGVQDLVDFLNDRITVGK